MEAAVFCFAPFKVKSANATHTPASTIIELEVNHSYLEHNALTQFEKPGSDSSH